MTDKHKQPRPFPPIYGEWVDAYLEGKVMLHPDGCHICTRRPSKTSGRLEVTRIGPDGKKRKLMVTRVLYARREDQHPEDLSRCLLTAHTCSNNACVNPEHIFLTKRKALTTGDLINPLVSSESQLENVAIPVFRTRWTDIGGAAAVAGVRPDDLRIALKRSAY